MARAISLIIATMIAAVLIGLAAPSFASRAEQRIRRSVSFMQAGHSVTCRSHDPALVQFDVDLGSELSPGRVIVVDDGTLAILIVAAEVDDAGHATAIDFAASLRISAIILRSGDTGDLRAFDPPVRNGANLRAQDAGPIDAVSFCYAVTFPAPPKALEPGATFEPSPTAELEPTATELTLDVSAEETEAARSTEIAATATAAADAAATNVAAAEVRASEIAASATAAADAASATVVAQQTAIAVAEAEAAAAQATLAAFEATLAAPTSTPSPEPSPTPIPTVIAYQTSGDDPFAGWDLPDGWRSEGGVLTTDGSSGDSWTVVPAPSTLANDMAVEIEFRVTGGDLCPRNFGVGIRMSENGYQAGGIEWACEPEVVTWSGAAPVSKHALPEGIDLAVGWHTMRVSAFGDDVTIAIDGVDVTTEPIPVESPGHLVALWSDGVSLEIRAVTVFETAP